MAKMTPKKLTAVSKRISEHSSQCEETTVRPGQRSHRGRTYTNHTREEDTDSQPVHEEILHQTLEIQRENTPDSLLWKNMDDNRKMAPLLTV